jgi:hypothetical protein
VLQHGEHSSVALTGPDLLGLGKPPAVTVFTDEEYCDIKNEWCGDHHATGHPTSHVRGPN